MGNAESVCLQLRTLVMEMVRMVLRRKKMNYLTAIRITCEQCRRKCRIILSMYQISYYLLIFSTCNLSLFN
jgi:hypothetical protein